MQPFKLIDDGNQIIKDLKYELQFITEDEVQIERINKLVDILEAFDSVMVEKYYTDAIETLIYSLLYELLMNAKAFSNEIPIDYIFERIKTDIFYGKEIKKREVISILKTHELNNKIKQGTVFENYTNFEPLLKEFINHIKIHIKWSKK